MSDIAAQIDNPSPKNIVLLSDGTGNSSAKIFKTNVWRLFQALELKHPEKQVAYYDDGVGTSSFKWWAAITGVLGIGLKRNVLTIYSFCCRNYNPGDKIYGFGFSRGSFTIRVVAGLIARVGLVQYDGNESHLAAQARAAYREYRSHFHTSFRIETPLRWLRDLFVPSLNWEKVDKVDKIQFLGLWDTVDAYGGPIEEITRAIDYWYWPLSMPDRFMNARIHRACHALSIEDARDAFRPVIWDERYVRRDDGRLYKIDRDPDADEETDHKWTADVSVEWKDKLTPIDNKRLSQVWFVGVHADIGGGYPQDGLSYVTLDWMIARVKPFGLLLDPFQLEQLKPLINPYDKLNDSRHGFAGYYRYRPRYIQEIYNAPPYKPSVWADIEYMFGELIGNENTQTEVKHDLKDKKWFVQPPPPTIHKSAFERISATLKVEQAPPFKVATEGYVPIVLPEAYHVTNEDGELLLANDPIDPGASRMTQSERVRNLVWWRRLVYFLTVFATLALAAAPLMQDPTLGANSWLALLRPLIALAAAFLPAFLAPWFEAYNAAPGYLALYGALLLGLVSIGTRLQKKILDVERVTWIGRPAGTGGLHFIVQWLRTRPAYKIFFYMLKHWWLPSIFAVLILATIFAVANQVAFRLRDSGGKFCADSAAPAAAGAVGKEIPFKTSDICTATQVTVAKGEEYRVTIKVTLDWSDYDYWSDYPWGNADRRIATDPKGYNWKKGMLHTSLRKLVLTPFRRVVFSRWFAPVLRVGSKGDEEVVLDLKQVPAKPEKAGYYEAKFTPKSKGEVFVFVNDAMYLWGNGYGNNMGDATIKIDHLQPVR